MTNINFDELGPNTLWPPCLDSYLYSYNSPGSSSAQQFVAPTIPVQSSLDKHNTAISKDALSDTFETRRALQLPTSSGLDGAVDSTKDDPVMPPHLKRLLYQLSASQLDFECIPQTPEIDALLEKSFSHEYFAPHHRLAVSDEGAHDALAFVELAILTHRIALENSHVGKDKSAWYPVVRHLLSAEDGISTLFLQATDSLPDERDVLQTIKVTEIVTMPPAPPPLTDVKLDYVMVHHNKFFIWHTFEYDIRTSVFANADLRGKIVVLGVTVESAFHDGQANAEYQLDAWGMKTLNLTKELAGKRWNPTEVCHMTVGLSVCGHAWSMYVSYWRDDGSIGTYGPVSLGVTDTLVGTMKIIGWVSIFKGWAKSELWGAWRQLLYDQHVIE